MNERIKLIARLREEANFLGYEFLTWLFLYVDHEEAKDNFTTMFGDDSYIILGQRLVTCLLNHKEQKTTIISPILEDSHEVFASFKNGHLVEVLSLSVSQGDVRVDVTLHAQDFAFTQVKIKDNFDNDNLVDEDGGLSEEDQLREDVFLRIKAIENVEAIIDKLYAHYCSLRLDKAMFSTSLEHMRAQIDKRLNFHQQKKSVIVSHDYRADSST